MSIFDKLKQGVSNAGNTAKNTVEETRLRSKMKKNLEEIDTYLLVIGKEIYIKGKNDKLVLNEHIENNIEKIDTLYQRNIRLEKEIQKVWNQKSCVCGKTVNLDSKFCPSCGHKFEEEKTIILENTNATLVEEVTIVEKEKTEEPKIDTSLFVCKECDAELESDARFCGECGTEMQ